RGSISAKGGQTMSKHTDTRMEPCDTVATPGAISPESTSPTAPALETPPVSAFLDLLVLIKQFGELPSSQWPWDVALDIQVTPPRCRRTARRTSDIRTLAG